jgi:hypothetical protein
MYFVRRHLPWISTLVLGLLLLAIGVVFLIQGFDVRNEIQEELRAEQIITSQDASIPGVLVEDADTARAQADVIKEHTLGTWGPYSELPREDPRRAQFVDGVALRTALNMAAMGFGITDVVIGAGVIVIIAGVATIALATPALYFLAGMVVRQEETTRA